MLKVLFNKTGTLPEHAADKELARKVSAGDEKATQQFIDAYFPRLYRYALLRLTHDEYAAEEVVQETLIIAARRIETYRGEASLFTWLTQICRRELFRFDKKDQRRNSILVLMDEDPLVRSIVESLESPTGNEPLEEYEKSQLANLVHLALDYLPNRYGDALEYKYIEGLSIKEIAVRMQIGTEATQSLLARARLAFKDAFGEIYMANQAVDTV